MIVRVCYGKGDQLRQTGGQGRRFFEIVKSRFRRLKSHILVCMNFLFCFVFLDGEITETLDGIEEVRV